MKVRFFYAMCKFPVEKFNEKMGVCVGILYWLSMILLMIHQIISIN